MHDRLVDSVGFYVAEKVFLDVGIELVLGRLVDSAGFYFAEKVLADVGIVPFGKSFLIYCYIDVCETFRLKRKNHVCPTFFNISIYPGLIYRYTRG